MNNKYKAVHDDGPCANGEFETPLDANGYCPICKIYPDMQSIALIRVVNPDDDANPLHPHS